jgi:hypothetical protein
VVQDISGQLPAKPFGRDLGYQGALPFFPEPEPTTMEELLTGEEGKSDEGPE